MYKSVLRSAGVVAPLALMAVLGAPAHAQSASDIADLRSQLDALRAAQAQSAARIGQLEGELAKARSASPAAPQPSFITANSTVDPKLQTQQAAGLVASASPAAPVNPAGGSAPGATPSPAPSKLTLNGDFRVRYESNWGDHDARNRDRGVLRARLRAAYAVNNWLTVGGQIATGDANDPNSTDITLSGFDNDLDVSLDQAYAKLSFGNLTTYVGKIPQPFVRTELVWDGDVSPQGVSTSYKMNLGGGASLRANALYFLVDESVAGPNSDMIGGQLAFETSASAPFKLELAAAYYDYSLRSTAGGDSGDFRTNRFAGGAYLSDYNLLDVIGAVTWSGLGDKWPLRVVGDYVHNYGATVKQDTGFGVDALFGRASKKGDWRFSYGYAETGVDAVLAAFSHDNTNIGTNYVQHSLAVDFVPVPNVILNATYYRYRPKSALYAGGNQPRDWIDRMRLNFLVNF